MGVGSALTELRRERGTSAASGWPSASLEPSSKVDRLSAILSCATAPSLYNPCANPLRAAHRSSVQGAAALGPPPPAPACEPNFRSRQARFWTAPNEIWSSLVRLSSRRERANSFERHAWCSPRTGVTGQRHKAIILRLQQHDHPHHAHSAPRVLDLQERACVSLGAERVRELSSCQLVAHARGT